MHFKYRFNFNDDEIILDFNGSKIEFVKEAKLLGVILDHKLNFNRHTDNVTKKVKSKTHLLTRSIRLFPDNFKSILFKLFIYPHFEYCSSLFFLTSKLNLIKLNKSFSKSIERFFNFSLDYTLPIQNQASFLSKFSLFPLNIRLFIHLSKLIYKIIKFKICTFLIPNFNNIAHLNLRSNSRISKSNSHFGKYSFSNISIKLLNNFINKNIDSSLNTFANYLLKDCIKLYNDNENVFFFSENCIK